MNEYAKWAIFFAVYFCSYIAFIVLIGEDNPEQPLSFFTWFVLKSLAALALYACYKLGKAFYKKGYFPAFVNRIIEW